MKSNKSGNQRVPKSKPPGHDKGTAVPATAPVAPSRVSTGGAAALSVPARLEDTLTKVIVWAFLLMFLLSFTQHGFFFIDDQKPAVFLVLLFSGAVFFVVKPNLHWRDPVTWGIGLFLSGHLLALLGAARPASAIHGVTVVVASIALFLLGRISVRGRDSARHLAIGLTCAAAIAVVHNMLNLAGILHSVDFMLGDRLGSVFQYPNTFGLFSMVGTFAALSLSLLHDRWWAYWHVGLILGLTGIITSQSRAIYLMLPVLLLIYGLMVGQRLLDELAYLAFDFGMAVIGSMVLLIPIRNPLVRSYWLLGAVAIAMVGSYYGVLLIRAGLNRIGKYARTASLALVGLTVLGVVAGALLYGDQMVKRLRSTFTDTSALGHFYTLYDGFRMVKAYPLGLGTDGWRAAYNLFSSFGYIMNAVHSYLIEVAIDGGVIAEMGLLLVAAVLLIRLWQGLRRRSERDEWERPVHLAIAVATAAVFLHAALDWDLAYMSLLFLFWLMLGFVDGWAAPRPSEHSSGATRPAVVLVGLVLLTLVSLQWSADTEIGTGIALANQNQLSKAVPLFRQAAALDPINSFAHMDLAVAMVQSSPPGDRQAQSIADKEFDAAIRYDPYYYLAYVRRGAYYAQTGRFEQAVKDMEQALKYGQWRPEPWAAYFKVLTDATQAAIKRADNPEIQRWVHAGREVLRRYDRQIAMQPEFIIKENGQWTFPGNNPELQQARAEFIKISASAP